MTEPVAVTSSGRDTRQQRAWYFYDWANSAYLTTTATVLMAPYLTAVATSAACPGLPEGERCTETLSLLGIPVAPGALFAYAATATTLLSIPLLLVVGGVADRSHRPTRMLAFFAWLGALAACAMFFVAGSTWQLGVFLLMVANLALASSFVVYDLLLVRIAGPDDRDRVSAKGWAFGYLGGGILLILNFVLNVFHSNLGLDRAMSTRISLLSAGLWWGLFTLIPVIGLRRIHGDPEPAAATSRGVIGGTLPQLVDTFHEIRRFPQTLEFLVAYLFVNGGIQIFIGNASLYGIAELQFSQATVLGIFLFVQFVAFGGSIGFGRLAARVGARRSVLLSIVIWSAVVLAAFVLPARNLWLFVVLALLIGLVLGGQALSRSLYSQLIPHGREAEFFSFYQAVERGTSWLGTLVFGVMYQWTLSYRWPVLAVLTFFVLGGGLLARVRVREGIEAAGNEVPHIV